MERTGTAAKWKEGIINDWLEKGREVWGDVLKEPMEAICRAEDREGEEVRVWLMEINSDELISLANRVEKQAAVETEPGLLIELARRSSTGGRTWQT